MYDDFSVDYDRFVDWPERLAVEMPFIVEQIGDSARVLDAACGTGMHAIALGQQGHEVAGADLSPGMIKRARANAEAAEADVRFEGHRILALVEEGISPNEIAGFEGCLDITEFLVDFGTDVARKIIVDDRCTLSHRFLGVEYGGQFLIFNVDQGDGFQGRVQIHSGHGRDFIPHIPDLVMAKEGFVVAGRADAVLHETSLFGGDHGLHARQALSPGGVNVEDAGVSQRALKQCPKKHRGHCQIIDILGPAGGLVRCIEPRCPAVDDREITHYSIPLGSFYRARTPDLRGPWSVVHCLKKEERLNPCPGYHMLRVYLATGLLDRLHNLLIPGAPAQIARDRLSDLRFGGPWIVIQKALGRENHPRCTKPALDRPLVHEGLLNRMKALRRFKRFDR